MSHGQTHRSNPCRICEVKICYENCIEKEVYLKNRAKGIYPVVSNLPNIKGNKYERGE
jgi:hypothetical protein